MSKKYVRPADFIVPVNINGLEGRMMYVASESKNNRGELLVVYDLDSNLERWWGLVISLRRYGNVLMADLPGLGGMHSLFSIGVKPSLDNMADYLASLVKLRYKRKKLTIIGIGFGFSVATRMLQRNPDLISKVQMIVSVNGYGHKDDFCYSDTSRFMKRIAYSIGSRRLAAFLLKQLFNNSKVLAIKYGSSTEGQSKKKIMENQFLTQFRIDVAKESDFRTRMVIGNELLSLDNCKVRIDKPMWHVTYRDEQSKLKPKLVEQHLRVIYPGYVHQSSKFTRKVPFVLNDDKLAIKLLPAKLRRTLKKA